MDNENSDSRISNHFDDNLFVTDVKGNVLKLLKDVSEKTDESFALVEDLIRDHNLEKALEILLLAEKCARMNADIVSLKRVINRIVEVCFDYKAWGFLTETICTLIRRRGQIRQAIIALVQFCYERVESIDDVELRVAFYVKITSETDGRVYVENERARFVQNLALIKESMGLLEEASNLMEDLHVDSYIHMPRSEKNEFMLEQLRLVCTLKKYTSAEVICNRMFEKNFMENFEICQRYHILVSKYRIVFKDYLEVSYHYKAMLDSKFLTPGTEIFKEYTKAAIIILLMAERNEKQIESINVLKKMKYIEDVHPYDELLKLFTEKELIDIDYIVKNYRDLFDVDMKDTVCPFDSETQEGQENWKVFMDRIVDFNIFVISIHYSSINLDTMASYLKLSTSEVEEHICELVRRDLLIAKINNPKGIVCFDEYKSQDEVLDEWNERFQKLLIDVDIVSDLITKEFGLLEKKVVEGTITSQIMDVALDELKSREPEEYEKYVQLT